MLDARGALQITTPPALPVADLVVNRPVATAAAVLPRIFNLCRAAQQVAAELALGIACTGTDVTEEIRRDHLMKICVAWPRALGLPVTLERDFLTDDAAALRAIFGTLGRVPRDDFEMQGWMGSGEGASAILMRIDATFLPGEATADDLPLVDDATAFWRGPVENSCAGRCATHPALGYVEAFHGRGPLWRAAGRMIDLGLILEHDIPAPRTPVPGAALVPATRGLYAVRATVEAGMVTAFDRITPTDHMLVEGGMLDRALSNLRPDRAALAPLLLEFMDPCHPVEIAELGNA